MTLTGAQAALFAEICFEFSNGNDVNHEINLERALAKVTLFSGLCPLQRLSLVREVMIGVLCKNEPMFPNTVQHHAAVVALRAFLCEKIDFEITSSVQDFTWSLNKNSDDFLFDVGQSDAVDYNSEEDGLSTDEELMQSKMEHILMQYLAEKLQRKKRREKFSIRYSEQFDQNFKDENTDEVTTLLFQGGPISKEERNLMRELSRAESKAFKWRLLCDQAFQQENSSFINLSLLNFDFRCQNIKKWKEATKLLFSNALFTNLSRREQSLVLSGKISVWSYCDPSKHNLIRELELKTKKIREEYEESWDESKVAYDQRCIFAVANPTKLLQANYSNQHWVDEFAQKAKEREIPLMDFQARLDLFLETNENHLDSLRIPWSAKYPTPVSADLQTYSAGVLNSLRPADFSPSWSDMKLSCHYSNKSSCRNIENLKQCSKCKVTVYCSSECQHKDWPSHQLICKKMAVLRKDKVKLIEIAKRKGKIEPKMYTKDMFLLSDKGDDERILNSIVSLETFMQRFFDSNSEIYELFIKRARNVEDFEVKSFEDFLQRLLPDQKKDVLISSLGLFKLKHAANCSHEEGQCPILPEQECEVTKQVWEHISKCNKRKCEYKMCDSTRKLLEHYSKCVEEDCCICKPVRATTPKTNGENSKDNSKNDNKVDVIIREGLRLCSRLAAESTLKNCEEKEKGIQQVMTHEKCSRSEAEEYLDAPMNAPMKDIELVKAESGCTLLQAEEALRKCGCDVTEAILSLHTLNFDSKDVDLVEKQTRCSRVNAIRALKKHNGDVVQSILSLSI